MKKRWITVLAVFLLLPIIAAAQSHSPTAGTSDCQVLHDGLKSLIDLKIPGLGGEMNSLPVREARLTPSGILFTTMDGRQLKLDYFAVDPKLHKTTWTLHQTVIMLTDPTIGVGGWSLVLPDRDKALLSDFYRALGNAVSAAHSHRPMNCTAPRMPLDEFKLKAAAWRALLAKPALADEIIKKRLLAEDAYAQKSFYKAVEFYEDGTKLDPTWAQGWFNAAMLYSELQDYQDAAECIQRYLILLPDAPDAIKSKEKLLWQAKAEENNSLH